jgi:NADPH2:quinone reductase
MRAETFSGYQGLKLVDLPKPAVTNGKVLVRMTSAGVTPLDHTILSGKFHGSKPPLVLGNEGAGVVEDRGGPDFPVGSRVMFFGAYGAFEDGTYREWVSVRKEDLCLVPGHIDDVSAEGIPRISPRRWLLLWLVFEQAKLFWHQRSEDRSVMQSRN